MICEDMVLKVLQNFRVLISKIKGKSMKIKIFQWILLIFLLPADLLYLLGGQKKVIDADLKRLLAETPYKKVGVLAFNYLLLINKPFRSIFYYRVRKSFVLKNISRIFIRPLNTIEINGRIKGGFRISHNYAVIHPESAGENLFVGHGVTIGKNDREKGQQRYPVIGDNVSIYANAVVFGSITVGNNVLIGAGAVVNKDIPDNCTVVGNPCRIISHIR